MRPAPILDFLKVLPQPRENFLPLLVSDLPLEFIQREVNDIVMMQFRRSDLIAEFKPDTVEEFDLLRCQVRRMGAKIENMFLAVWRVDFEG